MRSCGPGPTISDRRASPSCRNGIGIVLVACAALGSFGANAVEPERIGTVFSAPATPQPHWMWVYDANLSSMPDGRATLFDGDTGRVIGMLSTGYSFISLTLPSDYRKLYSAETYYTRHTRGTRTDVVTVYDPVTFAPTNEITLPTKRASTIPRFADSAITDDDRFMAVFNLTPATSLSIVDTQAEKFVGEIEIPGCAMAYAAGPRTLFSLCADGSVVASHLSDTGTLASRQRLTRFFSLEDPIIESGVRAGDIWRFISFGGWLYTLHANGTELRAGEKWNLFDPKERKAGWQSGGMLPIALHEATAHLYMLAYRAPERNHKLAGSEVWVYDLAARKRIQRIRTPTPVRAVQVTQDDRPLLFAISDTSSEFYVFDCADGKLLRTVREIGFTPILMQSPWVRPTSAAGR